MDDTAGATHRRNPAGHQSGARDRDPGRPPRPQRHILAFVAAEDGVSWREPVGAGLPLRTV